MDIRKEIRQFVNEVMAIDAGVDVEGLLDNESLIDAGVMDSLGVLKLISFLDEELDIDLPLENFQLDDFATLDRIFELVERHR